METQKTICITGAVGHAGSNMASYLLNMGHRVVGLKRRTSGDTLKNVKHLLNNKNFEIYEGDITDPSSMNLFVKTYMPDYLIHYAAQSHVHTSFSQPIYTVVCSSWNSGKAFSKLVNILSTKLLDHFIFRLKRRVSNDGVNCWPF